MRTRALESRSSPRAHAVHSPTPCARPRRALAHAGPLEKLRALQDTPCAPARGACSARALAATNPPCARERFWVGFLWRPPLISMAHKMRVSAVSAMLSFFGAGIGAHSRRWHALRAPSRRRAPSVHTLAAGTGTGRHKPCWHDPVRDLSDLRLGNNYPRLLRTTRLEAWEHTHLAVDHQVVDRSTYLAVTRCYTTGSGIYRAR